MVKKNILIFSYFMLSFSKSADASQALGLYLADFSLGAATVSHQGSSTSNRIRMSLLLVASLGETEFKCHMWYFGVLKHAVPLSVDNSSLTEEGSHH